MQKYISILRGINVGGKKPIKMTLLAEMFTTLGFGNIKTYIQSGNVIFETKKTNDSLLAKKISDAIKTTFNFDVPVIVFSENDFEKIINNNPYLKNKNSNPDFLHVSFLAEKPTSSAIEILTAAKEDFYLIEKAIYLYCPNGYSNCKLTNGFIESKLKITATTRNWKTTLQLLALAQE